MKLTHLLIGLAVVLMGVQVHSLTAAQFASFKESELTKAKLQACETALDQHSNMTKFGAMSPAELIAHLRKRF